MTPDQLREARGRLGLTQADVARLCGVETLAVKRWEAGDRGVPGYADVILHQYEQLLALPALRRDQARYHHLLDAARPTFSRAEALAICDALNGTLLDEHTAPYLWSDVEDAEGLGEKWQIDQAALVARLRGLSAASALAVVDAVERFWRDQADGADAALAASGLVAPADLEPEQATAGA